ncbi:DUF664 domain-containing protein [Williamsia sp. CHRR-6]|nr:DUF664 domain-containing protein [Williamsia sp. CHRR-6]
MITATDDVITETLRSMIAIVRELGDDQINRRPALPGANSPYVIVFHSVAATRFWLGTVIGGEQIPRDRAAEFTATGSVADLQQLVDSLVARIVEWVTVALTEGVRDRSGVGSTRRHQIATATPEWMLSHVIRELAQHLGQLELTRDVLVGSAQL